MTARFERLERAGVGGAAEVWRAADREQGGLVALKIERDVAARGQGALPRDAAEIGAAREALAREARHAALALSPRLPELVDVGAEGGRAYLALRWIEGRPLSQRAGDATARAELAMAVARDVGEALGDLHAIGLAHGDLKPDNLLVTPEGRIHVLDLGLACPLHQASVEGATLRYLARADADLGDARARDLLALGVLLAEIASPEVAAAADPIRAARAARLSPPGLGAICRALLSPDPTARPSAAWVTEAARAFGAEAERLSPEHQTAALRERQERDARRVRAAYLRLRRDELEEAAGAREDAAPWLAEAIRVVRRTRALSGEAADGGPARTLGPLDPHGLSRWLTALTGPSAAAWPVGALAQIPERTLAEALSALARRLPPRAWTLADVEAAALGRERAGALVAAWEASPLDPAAAAALALAVARVPPDPLALEAIERRLSAPPTLAVAAADALRRLGDLGRARSLVLREDVAAAPEAAALSAEVLRRAGDRALAAARAEAAIRAGADPEGRARAVLARIAVDEGRLDEAEATAGDALTAPLCEIRALCAARCGEEARALAEVERAEALAATAEERARAAALRGYVLHGRDPEGAHAAFVAAVDQAVRAGAVVEEATYRTGEAAAAVDLGEIAAAIATSTRAALLWDHLGRPAQAARALLACAAAHATVGMAHEAARAARQAIARARDAGDARAEAYAWWAIADVAPPPAGAGAGDLETEEGARAAERAAALLREGSGDDVLRAAARLLHHRPDALDTQRIEVLDRLASGDEPTGAAARLDWWGARAARRLFTGVETEEDRSDAILHALSALAGARAPIAACGPALAAGVDLAARAGATELARRLLSALSEAARELLRRAAASPAVADAARTLPWVARARAAPESGIRPEQARDLEALVASLSDRERLGPLLNRVVDALVLWTGVERGLLLLKAPNGALRPRAARNLARADLGPEQIALSQTLARRALDAGEPVVAVDAAGELPSVHHSVHALKLRSVLAVPLIARGEALGVVYLDDRVRRGAFGPDELRWARTIASLAALAIGDARDQVLLRRAARRAERASARLAEAVARKEAALDVAERELARARGARSTRFRYDAIVGESEPIFAMLRLVDRVTAADVPVLISGESGSGKELVARAIHENGPRAGRPFVSENCGAIPEGLLESALFGHVRGAFTGAERPRAGLFEVADRGTLFLDEIGEMSLPMQTKLLRVLEDGLVRPVGSERARKVDVRIIAATHRDLEAMVRARTFREDLFYRLNIITLRIPPLRERSSDIPLLVSYFVRKHGGGKERVTRAAMERLTAYAWPGNVRQLENEVRRALVLSDGAIDVDQLSPDIARRGAPPPTDLGLNVRQRIDALETELVRDALGRTRGNQTQAAKLLGLSRFGLQKMMKRLNIEA